MHIPDNMLDGRTALATAAISAAALGVALRQARLNLPPRRVPLMGLSAAFIFAAQMINFPLGVGTSAHLFGGVLASVLLGPSAAVVVLTAVLIVQALMLQDGGITALGANIFNMGVLGSVGGYAIYFTIMRLFRGLRGQVLAASFAAWCATVIASIACAAELALSGKAPWSAILPAMAGIHMLFGIGEGIITALVLVAINQTRPELLPGHDSQPMPLRYGPILVYGLLICLGLAMLSPVLASQSPDGLERVAELQGFYVPTTSWIDRIFGTEGAGKIAASIAGGLGTLVAFGLAMILARILVPVPQTQPVETPR